MKLILTLYTSFVNDSLYKNSAYLILGTVVTAVLGYFFWIINARMFSPEEVGIGTTLISSVSLLSSFCLLGLGGSLIKYLPTSTKKNEKINTSFTLIATASVVVSLIYLIFIDVFSPKLSFIRENLLFLLFFIFFVVTNSLNTISQNVFVAYRASFYGFVKNTAQSILKLIFPFFLAGLGAYGVFMSVGVPTAIAFLISIFFLVTRFGYIPNPSVNIEIVKTMSRFSTANYVMGFVSSLPALILPILITNLIGPEFSAFFYLDMMIASFLYIIPMATSQSLFAEGSYNDKEISVLLNKAIWIIFLLLVPATTGVLLFGKFILLTFGDKYSEEGIVLLRLLTLAALFISINYLGNTILYIKQKIREAVVLNLISTVVVLGLGFFLHREGLYGIGLAWVIGNGITSFYYLPIIASKKH